MSIPEKPTDDLSSTGERKALKPNPLYDAWLDRMDRDRLGRGRHAAISKNLYTFANYKTWADKVRGSWEPGTEGSNAKGPGPNKGGGDKGPR